jgi:lipoate-protein ligase A
MRRISEQVEDAEDHLALDEALLLEAEENDGGEALRVWEFGQPTVIMGRSSKVDVEVDRAFCQSHRIPVLRRCSGGASVVGGPGCLMYSVVLSLSRQSDLQKIDVAHRHVMGRVLQAVQRQVPAVDFQGTCDLTWNHRKCSGNSLRVSRNHLLYHGTVLYGADLDSIARCLTKAPRQPQYRAGRDHRNFITNIPTDPVRLAADIASVFEAQVDHGCPLPRDRMLQLRRDRYDCPAWHLRH